MDVVIRGQGEVAEGVIRLLTYVVGTVGNVVVIFVILFLGEYKKITHWYVLQLAFSDLLFLQTVPFWVTQVLDRRWTYGSGFCTFCYVILYLNYFSSILFLMIMAIDRYLAVCHGQKQWVQQLRSTTNCYIITLVTWVICLLLCIPLMMYSTTTGREPNCRCELNFPQDPNEWCNVYYQNHTLDDCFAKGSAYEMYYREPTCNPALPRAQETTGSADVGSSDYGSGGSGYYSGDIPESAKQTVPCKHDSLQPGMHTFTIATFVLFFVIPLIVISICYGLIMIKMRHKMMSSDSTTSQKTKGRKSIFSSRRRTSSTSSSAGRSKRDKKRVTILCVVLVGVFIVCWLPYHSMMLAMIRGFSTPNRHFCGTMFAVFTTLAYANSALNPYMYNFLGSFKKRLKQIKKHERTRSFLSGTRLTKVSMRITSMQSSEESKTKKYNGSTAAVTSEGDAVPLKSTEDPTTSTRL